MPTTTRWLIGIALVAMVTAVAACGGQQQQPAHQLLEALVVEPEHPAVAVDAQERLRLRVAEEPAEEANGPLRERPSGPCPQPTAPPRRLRGAPGSPRSSG